ncbi:MAG: lamin tail domain-containing protein [Dehalococcoidia bacterium]
MIITPTPTPEPTATPGGTVASRGDVLINEVQYNPPQSGTDTAYEWLEVYNNCSETIELVGWGIRDNGGYDVIPLMNISAHGFAVLAATDNFSVNFPAYSGAIIFVTDGRIGNGLSNDGDYLVLMDSNGDIIDNLSYGSDVTINASWMKKVGESHSMERQPAGGSFIDNSEPTPGFGLPLPAPSPVPISTPSPTAASTPGISPTPANTPLGTVANRSAILINEVQGNPLQSGSDSSYEWIELFNPSTEAVELIGWGISDNYEMDEIPSLNVSANSLVVIAASENFSVNFPNHNGTIVFTADGRIGNGLGNAGDRLILKDSAGTIIDEISYGDDESITSPSYPNVADGHSLERAPCGGQFVDNEVPTPGSCLPICDPTLVSTPTLIPTPTQVSVLTQILPESNLSDSINIASSHSTSLYRPASRMAHKSSSIDQPVESPGMPLRALLITLSSALVVILAWTLYKRVAR